jgi:hypothetical protein
MKEGQSLKKSANCRVSGGSGRRKPGARAGGSENADDPEEHESKGEPNQDADKTATSGSHRILF